MRLSVVVTACASLSFPALLGAETVKSPGGLDFHRPSRIYIVTGWCEFFDLRKRLPYYDDPGMREMVQDYATSSKAWKALIDWYSAEACAAFQKQLKDRLAEIYYNPEILALERPAASKITAAVADEALSGLVLIDHGWKGGRFYYDERKAILPDDFPERRVPVDFFGGAFCFSGHKGGGYSLKSWIDILHPTYSYAYDHVTWPGEILEDTKILMDELGQERRGQELNLMLRVMKDCKAGKKKTARWAAKKPFCDEIAAWGFLGDPDRFAVEDLSSGQKSLLHSVYLLYLKDERP